MAHKDPKEIAKEIYKERDSFIGLIKANFILNQLFLTTGNSKAAWKVITELEKLDENDDTTAKVETASKLGAKDLEDLSRLLSNQFKKKVNIKQRVKPNLIGGIVIRIDGKVIDESVLGKIEKLKESLK